jgi:hypothetical protein
MRARSLKSSNPGTIQLKEGGLPYKVLALTYALNLSLSHHFFTTQGCIAVLLPTANSPYPKEQGATEEEPRLPCGTKELLLYMSLTWECSRVERKQQQVMSSDKRLQPPPGHHLDQDSHNHEDQDSCQNCEPECVRAGCSCDAWGSVLRGGGGCQGSCCPRAMAQPCIT